MIIIKIRFSSVLVFEKKPDKKMELFLFEKLDNLRELWYHNENITQSRLAAASMEKCKKSLFDYLGSDMIMTQSRYLEHYNILYTHPNRENTEGGTNLYKHRINFEVKSKQAISEIFLRIFHPWPK